MPFDIFTMAAIHDEIAGMARARVDRVIQPSERSIALKLWGRGSGAWLVMSASPHPRVYLAADRLAKGAETPSPLLMLLRKYCAGARLEGARQAPLDRVLFVDLTGHEHGPVTLVAEIMGNRSNVILTRADGEILGAVKLVGPHQSRHRRILPHVSYMLPPSQSRLPAFGGGEKLDPLDADGLTAIGAALAAPLTDVTLEQTLVGLVRGCSPSVARDICLRAGAEPGTPFAGAAGEPVLTAVEAQYALMTTRAWTPITISRDGTVVDYRAYDSPPVEGGAAAPSMSRAVEMASEGLESADALQASRARVGGLVERRRGEVTARIDSLQRGLQSAAEADDLRRRGDLVMGYQYSIEPQSAALTLPDTGETIPLEPDRSPVENAERYYRRYRKAREAARQVPQLLEKAKHDAAFVEELATYVDLAETPMDLERIQAELEVAFGARPTSGRKTRREPGRPLSVRLPDGLQILVGRSARQNEEVTFRLAGRADLWFHARDVPGAHVVLKGSVGRELARDALAVQDAAALAAYYSKARSERLVDVHMTRVRDVHRVAGGPPGQVTLRRSETVRVAPRSPDEVAGQGDAV